MKTQELYAPVAFLAQNDQATVQLFEKRTIVELSDAELADVNGGSTPIFVASSGYCIGGAIAVTVFVASAVAGYMSK